MNIPRNIPRAGLSLEYPMPLGVWVFALDAADFTGSPTRYRFGDEPPD
jgi:hypothetical protein